MSLLNTYTGRPNPTLLNYYWPHLLRTRDRVDILHALETTEPPVIVLSVVDDVLFGSGLFSAEHPELIHYMETHYRPAARVGDWVVMSRRGAAGGS